MMSVFGIAVLLMMAATIAVHMGLPQAISGVIAKICECHKCMSFWITLAFLYLLGCNVLYAILLSLLMAYLSNWFAIVLILANKFYNRIWQKAKRK